LEKNSIGDREMGRNLYADMAIGMTPRNQVKASQLKNNNMVGGLINSGIGLLE